MQPLSSVRLGFGTLFLTLSVQFALSPFSTCILEGSRKAREANIVWFGIAPGQKFNEKTT